MMMKKAMAVIVVVRKCETEVIGNKRIEMQRKEMQSDNNIIINVRNNSGKFRTNCHRTPGYNFTCPNRLLLKCPDRRPQLQSCLRDP